MPCFCKDNEYKVKLADGLVVNCIPCKNPWNDSAGCKGDCEGRRHLCENTEPFPKTEAYECVKPETGLEFIEHHAVHTCRRCQTNEISFGCSCYADRRCECPEDTHSRDSTHNCVAREIEQVPTKIAPSFAPSIAPTSSLTETFLNTDIDTVNSLNSLNSSATAFAIKTTSESISPTASTLVVENSLVVEKVRPQSHKIPYETIILIVGLFVFVVLVVFALYFSFKNFIKKYLSKFLLYFL